jgi:cyanophycinase
MQLTEARGKLMVIGGAEDREGECHILKEFVRLANGEDARIVILTTATESPEELGKVYIKAFKRLGAKEVQMIDISTRADAMAKKNIEAIRKSTGLFFTGGDQLHITSLMGGTDLQKVINERYEKDLIIGGTSAGAAMMSNSMILTGDSDENPRVGAVEMAAGMDLIVGCIIDTHFSQRGRHGRLLTAVGHYPQDIGFGIDENTAMIVDKQGVKVIGEGSVTVIDASKMSYTNTSYVKKGKSLAMADVSIHVLPEGYKFNFKEQGTVIPKREMPKVKRAGANENTKSKKKN